ncbi:MAG: 4Fe-4S dicluster domain-containing protein [Phycisphaerae bacterium]|nr:4Fe-4S dicluster domain-containing protein [Phycisphaerae bacterium]
MTDDQSKKDLLELERATGNDFACCYQCGKCTAGCPAGGAMDNPPSVIMRLIQTGRIDEAMRSQSLWACMGCQTCTARCPQGMDIAATMDALREMAIVRGLVSPDKMRKRVEAFHISLLNAVRKTGRLAELALVTNYKLRTGTFLQDMDNGALMMLQGKINPFSLITGGERVEHIDQIVKIFETAEKAQSQGRVDKAQRRRPGKTEIAPSESVKIDTSMTIGYYPGCSLGGTAKDYDISTRKLCEKLGLTLREIDDWNCCGASSAHATNHKLSMLLTARNQVLADAQGFDYVLTPCASCLNRQVIGRNELLRSVELRNEIKEITGLEAKCRARFINPMELIFGLEPEFLAEKVVHSLKGLKVACYYGCLLSRPMNLMAGDDPENPTRMDQLMRAIGAEPVDWAFKVECCGAGLTMAEPGMIEELTHKIAKNVAENGAQAFVVACPLCHSNLDMRQRKMRKRFGDITPMPVYYLSELLAIACGADVQELALGKHFVSAMSLVRK